MCDLNSLNKTLASEQILLFHRVNRARPETHLFYHKRLENLDPGLDY